jgi:hypothetical protein
MKRNNMAYKKTLKIFNRIVYAVSIAILIIIFSIVIFPPLWDYISYSTETNEVKIIDEQTAKISENEDNTVISEIRKREKVKIVYQEDKKDEVTKKQSQKQVILPKPVAPDSKKEKEISYKGRTIVEQVKEDAEYVNQLIENIKERREQEAKERLITFKKEQKAKDLDALGVINLDKLPVLGYDVYKGKYYDRAFSNIDKKYSTLRYTCNKINFIPQTFKMNDLNKNALKDCTIIKGNLVLSKISTRGYYLPRNLKVMGNVYTPYSNDVFIPSSVIIDGKIIKYDQKMAMY